MKISYTNLLLGVCFLLVCCVSGCDNGLQSPPGFFGTLAGDWHLGTAYKINREEFAVSPCDRTTHLIFRALQSDFLGQKIPQSVQFSLDTFVRTTNKFLCSKTDLAWGTILGKRAVLPAINDFEITLKESCYQCSFRDIQYTDIKTCKTDSLPFSIVLLDEENLQIQFVSNVYGRENAAGPILDTIQLNLVRNNPLDEVEAKPFNIDDYVKVDWLRFETPLPMGTGAVEIQSDGINGNCLSSDDQSSSQQINWDLKTALGPDKKMTLSFWIKPASVFPMEQVIYSKQNGTDPNVGPFKMSLEENRLALSFNNTFEPVKFYSNKIIFADVWTNIALSYDDRDLLVCVNGAIDSRFSVPDWLYNADGTVLLANSFYAMQNNQSVGFQGAIDEVIFFEKYLSQNELFQLYQWHLNH